MNSQKKHSGKLIKTAFLMLVVTIFSISGIKIVNAATISDEGKYALVLNADENSIDGEYSKVIKFDVAEGETTVSLSELTKGIVPFNGKYEFSHWGKEIFDDEKADDELAIADFTSTGTCYMYDGTPIEYTNGLSLYAKFSDKPLKGSGTYYLTLDGFAGTINGKNKLTLTSSSSEYQTIDLTKYTPVREECTFRGWDLNGEFVTSVDAGAFADCDAVNVTATYTQDTFIGNDRVLILNANGGTIDGKASNKYDYLGGADSGTSMSLLPYTPVREGYTFNGWNSKSDGSGDNYKYLYWRLWDKNNSAETEKDTILFAGEYPVYQNLTLYATWMKNTETPTTPDEPVTTSQPTQDTVTVKEIQSTGDIKANIEFADGINKGYKLDIKKAEVKKELADKNVKFIADINVLDRDSVVRISDTKMKIRIALPEDLKGYDKYEVVYILNDEIKETMPATVEDGYIVFETSHLSQYGIVVTNTETTSSERDATAPTAGKTPDRPQTGDNSNITVVFAVLFVTCAGVIGCTTHSRRRKLN